MLEHSHKNITKHHNFIPKLGKDHGLLVEVQLQFFILSTIQYTGESLASHSGQLNPRKGLGWAGIMTEQYLLEKQTLNDSNVKQSHYRP
jgi:hypothetical protein